MWASIWGQKVPHDGNLHAKILDRSSPMLCSATPKLFLIYLFGSLENWYYKILLLMTGNLKNAKIAVDAFSICMTNNGWELMIPLAFSAATGYDFFLPFHLCSFFMKLVVLVRGKFIPNGGHEDLKSTCLQALISQRSR
ncbi:protein DETOXIFICATION 25-like [Macadamia integrifolia]|uniref:protein DETOXIFICATION 25-like n=1 Tax=Macadamia integrifolia TaxID=60698 RepID=UPI001C4FA7C3|nr:protein DETOXIFICATION 25-like [Macadamia integrifolia]